MQNIQTQVGNRAARFRSTYRHYRRQPDGTLKFLGEVAYTHDVEPPPDFDTMLKQHYGEDADTTRQAAEAACADAREAAETFEAFVDLASETEG